MWLPDNGSWGRALRHASLLVTTGVASGTAVAAALVLWRRSHPAKLPNVRRALLGSMSKGSQVPWSEVVRHDKLDDAWIVLSGEVYDVTPFIEEHPGGKLLLLAFAGRDATEPFETVGHSAVARRELRLLHLGEILEGSHIPAEHKEIRPTHHGTLVRQATLTGGRKATEAAEKREGSGGLWEVARHGFLPSSDPVGLEALRGTPFEPFADLADVLPALGFTGALRRQLDTDMELQVKLRACSDASALEGLSEGQLERAFSVVGYTMLAYWRGGTLAYSTGVRGDRGTQPPEAAQSPVTSGGSGCPMANGGSCGADLSSQAAKLPAFLSKPMLLLSNRLGRPPMIDYASTVLYNWVRVDKSGPITMSNIRCVLRLTGLIDEEWFFKTHVVIESEAAQAVTAVIAACKTCDDTALLSHLVALEEALWRVVRACLPIMYERAEDGTPKCSEHIFYQVLRPLIKSAPLLFEGDDKPAPRFLSGPSGAMSSLLPCVDAALGIQMSSEKLKEALGKFELSMPLQHRRFLEEIRDGTSIRQRILLGRPVAGEPHEQFDALVRSFNRCISRVLDFRWQHWQYVKNFIMKPGNISHAVGSGGTTFDYLQQHITDTEQARLHERCEGFSRLASPDAPDWPPLKLPPVSYHPALEFWSVDGKRGLLARDPLQRPEKSGWAKSLSPAMMKAVLALWSLAERLPALCAADGPFFEHCSNARDELSALQDDRAVLGMSEVAREHLMTTLCHISAGCIGCGHRRPPRCIEKPLQVVARSVGRPPRLDFTELVLCNWAATHGPLGDNVMALAAPQAEQAAGAGDAESQLRPPQLHVVWRFLASPDEEWYRAIHIVLHDEARDVVAAIRVGHVAMRDQNDLGVVGSMVKLSVWLNKFCDYFDAFFEYKDSRTESVMIRRLEPFISHGSVHDLTWEETACWVYHSGSSCLLPAVHAFLGVKMCECTTDEGAEGFKLAQMVRRSLEEGRVYMPRTHKEFVEELERHGVSLRGYCFRRFGARNLSVELLHDLEVGYNDALNALVRFLSRRVHLVSRFFPQLASSFGALHSEVEATMRQSRLQLLKMRQRVDRCLEK